MELQMFLEFPGVLITIGVVLLLISIIIIIIAYRSNNKDVDASRLSTNQTSYHGTINHNGYYDNGKPKIVLESNNNDDLEKTKVFKKPQNKNFPPDRPTGIKDQIEKIAHQENKKSMATPMPKAAPKPILPAEEELSTIDVFEEEFNTPSKEDLEKPTIKEAKTGDIINPRKEASKDNIKTVIKKPVYIEEDEDIELL